MTGKRADLAASIRQRLLDRSRERGEDHQVLLTRYGLERLLARLAASTHRDRFVLKGALLFALWTDRPHRATRDLDLLGHGPPERDVLIGTFREIVQTPVEDDGLVFDPKAITARPIREAAHYDGLRLKIPASLGKTRLALQVDVAFGDAVSPRPKLVGYPTILDHASPRVRAYPREAVVAEKLEAMVSLGMVNSRMKDFHDLWVLAREHDFDGATLSASIAATFRRRATSVPPSPPSALTEAFWVEPERRQLWAAFLSRTGLSVPAELRQAVEVISVFVGPILTAIAEGEEFGGAWTAGGPWTAP